MSDLDTKIPGNAPSDVDTAVQMSFLEKAQFCALPVLLMLNALLVLPVVALSLIGFLWNFIFRTHSIDGYARLALISIVIFCAACVVLVYSVAKSREMLLRKKKTGSIFPAGDELTTTRRRNKRQVLWKKLPVIAFFFLIAIGSTCSLLASPHYWAPYWIIPVLMWVVAVLVAVDCLPGERIWLGFAVSATYLFAAFCGVFFAVASREHRSSNWTFPAVMAGMSVLFMIFSFSFKSQVRARKSVSPCKS